MNPSKPDCAPTFHCDGCDALGTAIAHAAIKAGIIDGSQPLTGPQLIMLCDDLATAATPAVGGEHEENRAAIALLDEWLKQPIGDHDDKFGRELRRIIDENRLSDRKFWPDEAARTEGYAKGREDAAKVAEKSSTKVAQAIADEIRQLKEQL